MRGYAVASAVACTGDLRPKLASGFYRNPIGYKHCLGPLSWVNSEEAGFWPGGHRH